MRNIIPVVLVALAMFGVVGCAVLAWLPSSWRTVMLPATPLLGVMALTVSLHFTGGLLGVRIGLPITLFAALLVLLLRSRTTSWWRDLRGWRWLGVGLVVGGLAAWMLMAPARPLGLAMVAPGGSDDGFGYATQSAWLIDHAITDAPSRDAAPVWRYTGDALSIGLRLGEELDHAAVAFVTGHDPEGTWYVVSCLWVMLLPGALISAALALRLPAGVGAVAGAAAAGSSVVMSQIVDSYTSATLGLAMAPLALSTVYRYFEVGPTDEGSHPTLPVWFVAVALTAWVSTYTEYLPIVGLGIVGCVLLHRHPAFLRALRLAVAMVVIGALAWFRAVHSLTFTTATFQIPGAASPFLGVPVRTAAAHYVGTLGFLAPGGTGSSYLIIVAGLGGLVLSVWLSPARRFFILMLGSAAFTIAVLSTVRYYPYAQGRALSVTFPLVALAVAAGYAAAIQRLMLLGPLRSVGQAGACLCAVLTAAFLIVNGNTMAPYLEPIPHQYGSSLHLDHGPYDAARDWLRSVAGTDGHDATVVETQAFERGWLMYTLRDMPRIRYQTSLPTFKRNAGATDLFGGPGRRYAVVEQGVVNRVAPGVVVGRAGSFLLLDLQAGPYVMAVGTTNFDAVSTDAGVRGQWMSDDGDVVITHDPTTTEVVLGLRSVPEAPPQTVDITVGRESLPPALVGAQQVDVTMRVPQDQTVTIHIHNRRDASVIAPDPRPRSVEILEVRGVVAAARA
ncbi:MAG: hypothetical protein ACR2GX_03400 [Candidatus Dormibacteria bacterium]